MEWIFRTKGCCLAGNEGVPDGLGGWNHYGKRKKQAFFYWGVVTRMVKKRGWSKSEGGQKVRALRSTSKSHGLNAEIVALGQTKERMMHLPHSPPVTTNHGPLQEHVVRLASPKGY